MAGHFDHEQRQRQHRGNGEVPLQPLVFGILRRLVRVRRACGLEPMRLIARLADRCLDVPQGGAAHHLHAGALGGEVDGSGDDARHGGNGLLHPAHAGGAGHALDPDVQRLARHVISGRPDGGDHIFRACRRGKAHVGAFSREIYGGALHAGNGGNGLLHAPDAGGAGHAFDGEALQGCGGGCHGEYSSTLTQAGPSNDGRVKPQVQGQIGQPLHGAHAPVPDQ